MGVQAKGAQNGVLIQFGITTKIIAVNKVIAKLSRNKRDRSGDCIRLSTGNWIGNCQSDYGSSSIRLPPTAAGYICRDRRWSWTEYRLGKYMGRRYF